VTSTDIGRKVGELLFKAGAINCNRSQPFILAAGWASPVYIDVRTLFGDFEIRRELIDLAYHYLNTEMAPLTFDAIVGAETAGMPFATSLADRTRLPFRYARKRSLGIGRDAQVEGGPVNGMRALLVDDLTTDGTSKLGFAKGMRAAGATVEHVLCVFFHDAFPGTEERLQTAGLKLHALAGWSDLLQVGSGHGLSAEDRSEIERFLADPVAWSARNGGRLTAAIIR
jgi:orotate phosphoribosyltransferase